MISDSNSEVARAHSVEELLSSSPEPPAPSDVTPPEGPRSLPARPQLATKGHGSKFDWKNFQEAVCCSYFSVCHFFELVCFSKLFSFLECISAVVYFKFFPDVLKPQIKYLCFVSEMTSGLILRSEGFQEIRNSNFEVGDG